MILIIADDLSGAAELAGIAASRGYSAEVHTELDTSSEAEVIAVDSQTRSLPAGGAAEKIKSIVESAKELPPGWIYKKTDSVLRGNIRAELEALLSATGKQRALFIPANPGKQRCIRGGTYLVDGVPLNETVFANDPDHPQRTANVIEALGQGQLEIQSIPENEPLPQSGIVVPDINTCEHIAARVSEVGPGTVAAGAAEFFHALLNARSTDRKPSLNTRFETGRLLFVCGSLAAWEQNIAHRMKTGNVPIFTAGQHKGLRDALKDGDKAMVAIGDASNTKNSSPEALLEQLIDTAAAAGDLNLDYIFLEGGATASAFMARQGWKRFRVLPSDMLGVGCLRPSTDSFAPTLLVKPGSYPWPEEIWATIP